MRQLQPCILFLFAAVAVGAQEPFGSTLDGAIAKTLQAAADSAMAPRYRTREPMRSHGDPRPSPKLGEAQKDGEDPLPLGIGGAVTPDKTSRGGGSW
jgi:hypothetical protein